jgi:Cft2 family RNA processing exonuclease
MKSICFKVKSSSGGTYDVTFQNKDSILVVFCSCKAGTYGNLCKHKTRLLNGDESILYNQADVPALREILELIRQSQYIKLLEEHDALKKEIENAKEKERIFRHRIEKVLAEGIPIGVNRI